MATAAIVLATLAGAALAQQPQIDHVIHVSIDGLRPDAIRVLGPQVLPNFYRFRLEGAMTDNARCDPDLTATIPNHTSQITARPIFGPAGHGWARNDRPLPTETIHLNKGSYVPSVFDVAHDHGLSTGLYAGPIEFVLWDQSYDGVNGAADQTGPDDGRDKIDLYFRNTDTGVLVSRFISDMTATPLDYAFLHIVDTDHCGHDLGFDPTPGTAYSNAVIQTDTFLGQIFNLVESTAAFAGRTIIVLTSDHGGKGNHHFPEHVPEHYIIPLYVWGPGVAQNTNLYAINPATRLAPGAGRPPYSDPVQPIRHGDTANLELAFLGLPPIPGSVMNQNVDLNVLGGANLSPIAVATSNVSSGNAALAVDFDATASTDPDGAVFSYVWDFGDGAVATGALASHTFAAVGQYTVGLLVTDDLGASDFTTVAIGVDFNEVDAPVIRDSTLDSQGPALNFGGNDRMQLTRVSGILDHARCVLAFDLSAVPPWATILDARLRATCTDFNGVMNVGAYPLLRDWTEGAGNGQAGDPAAALDVNWLSTSRGRPGDQAWSIPGGDVDFGAGSFAPLIGLGEVEWDLTAVVQGWHAGTRPDHGVLLRATTGADFTTNELASREDADPSLHPRLVVVWTGQNPNQPPLLTMEPTDPAVVPGDQLVITLDDPEGLLDLVGFALDVNVHGTWYPFLRPELFNLFVFDFDPMGRFRITWPDLGSVTQLVGLVYWHFRGRLVDSAGNETELIRPYWPPFFP